MKKLICGVFLLPVVCGLAFPGVAIAEPLTAGSVEQLVRKSPAFGKGRKVTVAISGGEVALSTYVLTSHAPGTDLKIEALAVSKEIIDADPSVARVKLHFYEPSAPAHYREVVVTISDIKAFSSGAITKDQLLAALHVEALIDEQQAQALGQARKRAGTQNSWDVSKEPLENGYFVKFQAGDGSYISIRHTASDKDVAAWVVDEDREHEQRHDYARVAVPQFLRIGPKGSIVAYNRAYSRGAAGKLTYNQYVYFGWPKNKYKFKLDAPQKVYIGSAQVFTSMLNSVQISQ
jgi:hypothetical protein